MNGLIFAILAGVAWGIVEVFTKSVLHSKEVGPITAITIRTTIAMPLLWITYFVVVHQMSLEPKEWFRTISTPVILYFLKK